MRLVETLSDDELHQVALEDLLVVHPLPMTCQQDEELILGHLHEMVLVVDRALVVLALGLALVAHVALVVLALALADLALVLLLLVEPRLLLLQLCEDRLFGVLDATPHALVELEVLLIRGCPLVVRARVVGDVLRLLVLAPADLRAPKLTMTVKAATRELVLALADLALVRGGDVLDHLAQHIMLVVQAHVLVQDDDLGLVGGAADCLVRALALEVAVVMIEVAIHMTSWDELL